MCECISVSCGFWESLHDSRSQPSLGMAIPQLGIAKMQALELGALKAITTIHTAQAQYQSQYGRYASTLAELGPAAAGAPNAAAAGLISRGLASGEERG